jgi:two-component system sensor histidine kinase VicK
MFEWTSKLVSAENLLSMPIDTRLLIVGLVAVLLFRSVKITWAHEASIRLKDEELALYRRAMETHAMMNISAADGRMTYVNATFTAATGYTEGELIGARFKDVLLHGEGPEGAALRRKIGSGETWTGETAIRRKDGSHFWTQTTVVPMMDAKGNLEKTISLRTDITESKLLQAESQDHAMLDRLRDEVYVFTTDTLELLYLNKRALAFQGWTAADVTGKHLADTTDGFDDAAFRNRVAGLISGEVDSLLYESVIRDVPVEIGLQLEFGLSGKPRFLAVVRDITARRKAEQGKAEFISTVSHELRSPLTSIRGALKLINSGSVGALPDKPARLMSVALRNVDRLMLLINDILDLEKLDSGKSDFRFETLDLAALVEEAIAANAGYGHEYGVEFRPAGTGMPVLIDASRDRLMQVLTNLLSNAAKFSRRGSAVEIAVEEAAEHARLTVTDQGIGIPEGCQTRLFERFAQAEAPANHKRGGSGLGLSIAKTIVERHSGRIWFTSKVDIGTTFYVDLPKRSGIDAAA